MFRKVLTQVSLVVAVSMTLAAGTANAQAIDPNGWAKKMFSELSHDFGYVAKDSDQRHSITITNLYKETVHIASIATSCGCTAVKPSVDTIKSLETSNVEVTMNTVKFVGQKDSSITITFDQPYYATVTIPIRAYIRTDLRLTPGSINFQTVTKGSTVEKKLDVAYANRPDWKIESVKAKNPHLNVAVKETVRDQFGRVNYDLSVTLLPTAPVGPFRDIVTLRTNDITSVEIPVLVEGNVQKAYSASSDLVQFGTVQGGQRKTVDVLITGPQPFTISRLESEKTTLFTIPSEALKVGPRKIQRLPLTLKAPLESATIDETFTVTIEGVTEPVQFRVYAKVAGSTATPSTASVPATATTNAVAESSAQGTKPENN